EPSPSTDNSRQSRQLVGLNASEGTFTQRTAGGSSNRPPANFTLAAANLIGGSSLGSSIASPGANSVTTSIDGSGNFLPGSGGGIGASTTNVDVTPFGTARVIRFSPASSSFSTPRTDTGIVSVPGFGTGTGNSFFRNLATGSLPVD